MNRTTLPAHRATPATVWPRVDIYEGDDDFLIVADLPGVRPDDVDVQLEGDRLTLQANRSDTAEGEAVARELSRRDFSRRFKVGVPVDTDAISATMKDGVLHLRLPKAEQARPRRIQVTAEA